MDAFSSKNLQFIPFPKKKKTPSFNPLPDMPILGFSNSAANKGMMSKIWKNGDLII